MIKRTARRSSEYVHERLKLYPKALVYYHNSELPIGYV